MPNSLTRLALPSNRRSAKRRWRGNLGFVADGFLLKREDRSQKDLYVQLIDYSGLPLLAMIEGLFDKDRLRQVLRDFS